MQHSVGGATNEVTAPAHALIVQNLANQAFIQGINDDFLVGAIITITLIVPDVF